MSLAISGHEPVLTAALLEFSNQLSERGIAWVVLRNDQGFPAPRSRYSDIDLLVDPQHMAAARQLFLKVFQLAQAQVAVMYSHLDGGLESYFVTHSGSPALHIDLFCQVSYRGRALYPADLLLCERRPVGQHYVPRRGHAAAIACANYCLRHGKVKDEYRAGIREAALADRQGMLDFFAHRLSASGAAQVVAAIEGEDWSGAARLILRLRSVGPIRYLRHAWQATGNLLQRLIFRAPGLFVAFMGPDGAGKSTLIKAYATRMDTLYLPGKQKVMHWRPRLLPGPGELIAKAAPVAVDATQPHLKPPYGFAKSLARLAYFVTDYLVGGLAFIYPALLKGRLLIGDRYFHDMWLDRRRYRLGLPCWLIRVAGCIVPRPDLTFLLTAPASILHARKQELTIEELQRQLDALKELPGQIAGTCRIDVDRPVETIVDELEAASIQFLANRTRRQFFAKGRT